MGGALKDGGELIGQLQGVTLTAGDSLLRTFGAFTRSFRDTHASFDSGYTSPLGLKSVSSSLKPLSSLELGLALGMLRRRTHGIICAINELN